MDQKELARTGEFPMEFTDLHDLDIDFLIDRAMVYQRQDIELVGQLLHQLQLSPAAKSLAEETLGMAKGHLQSLQELVQEQTADSTGSTGGQ
jgi:hypothetical protein